GCSRGARGAQGSRGVAPDELVEVLVQRYPEGAQIGWHRDAPNFGTAVGMSLLGPSRLRFRRATGDDRRTFEVALAPRSGYVLAGPARTAWQHHIPPTKTLRYSITLRTLRAPRRGTARPAGAAPSAGPRGGGARRRGRAWTPRAARHAPCPRARAAAARRPRSRGRRGGSRPGRRRRARPSLPGRR